MSRKPLFHSLFLIPLLVACSFHFDDPIVTESHQDIPMNDTEFDAEGWPQALLVLVNDLRQKGCQCGNRYMSPTTPLELEEHLTQAAQIHADDMSQRHFFNHKGSDGSRVGDRATRVGYNWQVVGENISAGYPNVVEAFNGWKTSPPHCQNMMSPDFRHMGAGKQGTYWVQTFGKRFD